MNIEKKLNKLFSWQPRIKQIRRQEQEEWHDHGGDQRGAG